MEEEYNFRRNKMNSMIASYKNKVKRNVGTRRASLYDKNKPVFEDQKLVVNIKEVEGKTPNAPTQGTQSNTHSGPSQNSKPLFQKLFINNNLIPNSYEAATHKDLPADSPPIMPLPQTQLPEKSIKASEDVSQEDISQEIDLKAEDPQVPKGKKKRKKKKLQKEEKQDEKSDINPNEINIKKLEDIGDFVFTPALKSTITFKCQIKRDASGLDRSIYPVYILYHENACGKNLFLLSARTRKKTAKSTYILSLDPVIINKNDSSYIGKIKSNIMGTKFSFVGNEGTEISSVNYEYNPMGVRGPRRIKVTIPKELKYKNNHSPQEVDNFLNKFPEWNKEYRSYILNFGGRVTEPSIKNFQLVRPDNNAEILMQFGKVGTDKYSLDFVYPFSPVQAFSIALTTFASKFARE